MKLDDVRWRYLDFMKRKGHALLEPSPLVLENDPTTLFTGAGMQPLLPFLLGESHPAGTALADCQPCIRAQDIEDVGDTRHTTCFEMLGNWSLGHPGYFKELQIRNFFEFLTKEVGLPPEKIYVTCFIGAPGRGIPRDDESAAIWRKVFHEAGVMAETAIIGSSEQGDKRGIKQGERIFFYDDRENWWSRGGGLDGTPIGDPCGPDSEVFFDYGAEAHDPRFGMPHPASDGGRFVEIGNQVFMEYRRVPDGSFKPLARKNVDFGGGLERITAAALGTRDVFRTSGFAPVIEALAKLSGKPYEGNERPMRIIADHLKGAVFLAAQGLVPGNKKQGYVMRRLLRRSMLQGLRLGMEGNFFDTVCPVIIQSYKDCYLKLGVGEQQVLAVLNREEKIFRSSLRTGLRELDKLVKSAAGEVSGKDLFRMHDTYGFPVELSVEELGRREFPISANWQVEYHAAQELQRQASKGVGKAANLSCQSSISSGCQKSNPSGVTP